MRIVKGTAVYTAAFTPPTQLFNITNTNANETRTITTGVAFLRPTAVLAPRTMRIGARVSW